MPKHSMSGFGNQSQSPSPRAAVASASIDSTRFRDTPCPYPEGLNRVYEEQVTPGAGQRTTGLFVQNIRTSAPLLLADVFALAIACTVALLFQAFAAGTPELPGKVELPLVISAGFVIAFFLFDLYPAIGLAAAAEFRKTALASTVVMAGAAPACFAQSSSTYESLTMLMILWMVAMVAVPLLRQAARSLCSGFEWWTQPILVVGSEKFVPKVCDAIKNDLKSGLRPLGVIRDLETEALVRNEEAKPDVDRSLAGLGRRYSAHRAIVTSSSPDLASLVASGLSLPYVHVISNQADQPALWASVGERGGLSEVQFCDYLLLPTSQFVKRFMDLALIVTAAPLLLPICGSVTLLVKLSSPGPVLYRQRRLGRGGRHFYVWKFRSMVTDADRVLDEHLNANPRLREEWKKDQKLRNDPRVTAIGAFIRKTSLDELPQLWNVLVGEMSLVGPRPIVDAEVSKYGDVYPLYQKVIPGITGIWQISGRNNTTYEERLGFDRYYVKNWSPWLDAYILLRTIRTVLLREGAY